MNIIWIIQIIGLTLFDLNVSTCNMNKWKSGKKKEYLDSRIDRILENVNFCCVFWLNYF